MLVLRIDEDARLRASRTPAARRRASPRPTARTPSPPGSRGRKARRGSAGRRRPRLRSTPEPASWATRPASSIPARPSRAARSGPSPTNVSVPSPRASKARASRRTFLRSESAPEAEKRSSRRRCQPTSSAALARTSRGEKRSRSTPQSITSVFPRASGTASTSRSRSHLETAMTADARRTTCRVAARTAAFCRAFSTSCPCAVTTSGARDASAPRRPAGTRKCA